MNTKESIINKYQEYINEYENEISAWVKVLTDVDYTVDDINHAFLSAEIIYDDYEHYYSISTYNNDYYCLDIAGCKDMVDIIKVINKRLDDLMEWKKQDESVIEFTNEKYDKFNSFIQNFMNDNDDRQYEALHFLQAYFENHI